MNIAARASGLATLMLCVGAVAVACSASSSGAPALSSCVPMPDGAPCNVVTGGGGGSGPHGGDGGGTTGEDGAVTDAGACGTAAEVINATNNTCAPCIETSCCQAASRCTGQCLSVVSCPSMSINSCATTYASGYSAYVDLVNCIDANCTPMCPTLPTASPGDI